MTNTRKRRIMKYRQKQLNQTFKNLFVANLSIVFMIMFTVVAKTSENNKIDDRNQLTVYESVIADANNLNEKDNHDTAISSATVLHDSSFVTLENATEQKFTRNLSEREKYLLAKIAMAEGEGESLETKVRIILVILNRAKSNEPYFPDTIEEVIFQKLNGVYQFTPIGDGRWNRVEPNAECWEAVDIVNTTEYDFSQGALYFEACSGESWHSRNLEFVCKSDNTRFYK